MPKQNAWLIGHLFLHIITWKIPFLIFFFKLRWKDVKIKKKTFCVLVKNRIVRISLKTCLVHWFLFNKFSIIIDLNFISSVHFLEPLDLSLWFNHFLFLLNLHVFFSFLNQSKFWFNITFNVIGFQKIWNYWFIK